MKGSRACYGCGGSGRRGIFECAVCSGTGEVTAPRCRRTPIRFGPGLSGPQTGGPGSPSASRRLRFGVADASRRGKHSERSYVGARRCCGTSRNRRCCRGAELDRGGVESARRCGKGATLQEFRDQRREGWGRIGRNSYGIAHGVSTTTKNLGDAFRSDGRRVRMELVNMEADAQLRQAAGRERAPSRVRS